MNRRMFAAWCAALILGSLAWATSRVDAAGDPIKGKALYENNCLVCHGPQGKGDGPSGKVLKPPAADLTSASSKEKSEAELRQVIENGKPGTGMGPWKTQLKASQVNDLMEYVMSLRK
jgi:mono/diheme cytochrome c family protein